MKRTPRGREVTELAYKHLGRSLYNSQKRCLMTNIKRHVTKWY